MDRIILWGRDHTELGVSAVESNGSAAVGISRGRHPKPYPYVDPNEDAVMAATSGDMVVLAVADGHGGAEASHLVIETIHEAVATGVGGTPEQAVDDLVDRARTALAEAAPLADSRSGTTLTILAAGRGRRAVSGWGDSAAAQVRAGRGQALGKQHNNFAYLGETPPALSRPTRFAASTGELLVVASDGLTDFLVRPWAQSLASSVGPLTDPVAVVEAAIGAAGDGGGSDNIAVAAFFAEDW